MVTSLPLPAPVRPAPLLLAPVPFCLLALSFLPVPACSGTCRLCLLPLPRLSPLVCRPMVTSLPFPAPVGPCQSLFATARCRYPRHHAKRITPSTRPAIRFCSSRATIFRPLRFPSLSLAPLPHLPQLALSCLSLQPLPHLRLSAPVRPVPPRAVRTRPLSTHASF